MTRNYPRPNCLLKCLPKLSLPHKRGLFILFQINPVVRATARQARDKNCLAAIFAPRHQSICSGPLGTLARPRPRPASPVPRPVLARPRPFLARSSPGLRPALASSNLDVTTGKKKLTNGGDSWCVFSVVFVAMETKHENSS